MANYLEMKRIALGLKKTSFTPIETDDIWNVAVESPAMENPYQFLEKSIQAPEECIIRREALSIFPEYDVDQLQAMELLSTLNEYASNGKPADLQKLLEQNPASEWLSFVFIDENQMNQKFYLVMDSFSPTCRETLHEHIKIELKKLLAFKELFEDSVKRLEIINS